MVAAVVVAEAEAVAAKLLQGEPSRSKGGSSVHEASSDQRSNANRMTSLGPMPKGKQPSA